MDQELKIWANTLGTDGVAGNTQRRDLTEEEFIDGWKRLSGVSYQQLNQLFFLLTGYSSPSEVAPYLFYTDGGATLPSTALTMNGQSISSSSNPILYEHYGSTLPDMTEDAPTGFVYIVRNH